jgi:hypothetical protein
MAIEDKFDFRQTNNQIKRVDSYLKKDTMQGVTHFTNYWSGILDITIMGKTLLPATPNNSYELNVFLNHGFNAKFPGLTPFYFLYGLNNFISTTQGGNNDITYRQTQSGILSPMMYTYHGDTIPSPGQDMGLQYYPNGFIGTFGDVFPGGNLDPATKDFWWGQWGVAGDGAGGVNIVIPPQTIRTIVSLVYFSQPLPSLSDNTDTAGRGGGVSTYYETVNIFVPGSPVS